MGASFQIDEINTAKWIWIWGTDNTEAESQDPRGPSVEQVAGFEQSGTRQDRGAWFCSDKHYAGSLAIKLYSEPVVQSKHNENETSSDIRRSFLENDGVSVNPSLKKIRDAFVASG